MIAFAVRRLAAAVLIAFVASVAAFVLFWTIPNVDPAYNLGGGQRGNETTRAQAAEEYGLDESLPAQYLGIVGGVLDGSAECYTACESLRDAFLEALPVTLWLIAGAAAIALGLGVWLGMACARDPGSQTDRAIGALASALVSTPALVAAALLYAFLALRWGIAPQEGYTPLHEDPLAWLGHMIVPWLAAGLPFAGAYVQVVRSSLIETSHGDWVRTARAKGLSERAVMYRHVLRNALVQPLSVLGLDISHAFGGFALYVEAIFGLPGIGALTAETIEGLDLPPLVGLAILLSIVVVLANALVDIAIAALDPRLRDRATRAGRDRA
ncbi:ABC transporter permease [Thermoleophilia bacterium SCSIO 60948]|nr:ABC transporter permease [Thermoleophilia bacterium SCSIO 60948]